MKTKPKQYDLDPLTSFIASQIKKLESLKVSGESGIGLSCINTTPPSAPNRNRMESKPKHPRRATHRY